jgi:hypothetical protein
MKHRIGLTVTDPNHPMVSKRKETIQKTVRVTGDDKEKAINSAIAHYKRKGYKVHDHHYIGTVQEGYGRNRGYAHGFASPHAPSLGGRRHREDDEGWDREPKQADVPHAVHINGKKWKSFSSQSHAQNVANKIKGATVHKEEVELGEARKANTASARAELAKRPAKPLTGADAEKKKKESDAAWQRLMAHAASQGTPIKIKEDADLEEGYNDIGPEYGGAGKGRSADAMETAKLTRHAKAAAKKAGKTFNTSAEYRGWHMKQQEKQAKKTVKEADAFELGHNAQAVKSQLKSTRQTAETKAKSIAAQAINKTKTDAAMKEDIQIVDEAWNQGNRNPQKGIKVGHKVRSYDFPGMHDDHYVEGHVVGETPHSYHIRVNKVVRSGKEIPTPAHMTNVEAPKGKGMFNNAYAVHKIMAKQQDVAAAPEPAKGGAKTFANIRGKK